MNDLHETIHRIVTLGSVTPEGIGRATGVSLSKKKENPSAVFYGGGPAGAIEDVHLALSKTDLTWHVAWTYDANRMPSEGDLDLGRYGARVTTNINPRIPPEGTFSHVYDYMGFRLFIQFNTRSRRLRGAALHKL